MLTGAWERTKTVKWCTVQESTAGLSQSNEFMNMNVILSVLDRITTNTQIIPCKHFSKCDDIAHVHVYAKQSNRQESYPSLFPCRGTYVSEVSQLITSSPA